MTDSRIAVTTEIMGAVLGVSLDCPREFKADPKAYIFSHLNYEIGDGISVVVAENDSKTIHIALPYYESFQRASGTRLLDADVEHTAAGFEVFIVGSIVATAITVGTVASVSGTVVAAGTVAVGVGVGLHTIDK